MNKEREEIIKQIHDTSIEDLKMDTPKPSKKVRFKEILKDFLLGPIRFWGAFLGVTEENIGSSGKTSSHGAGETGHNHAHKHSSGSTFRDSISFDPSKAYMERIQEKAYFSMIDGKGDHDCDHEH